MLALNAVNDRFEHFIHLIHVLFFKSKVIYTSIQWLGHPLSQNTRKMTHIISKFIPMHHKLYK